MQKLTSVAEVLFRRSARKLANYKFDATDSFLLYFLFFFAVTASNQLIFFPKSTEKLA